MDRFSCEPFTCSLLGKLAELDVSVLADSQPAELMG